MNCVTRTPFSEWLEQKYLEWQIKNGRKPIDDFAEMLSIPRSILSHYMNGRNKPAGENVQKLAVLGIEIYDLLGLARPDPGLQYLTRIWDRLSENDQKSILEAAENYAAQNTRGQNELEAKTKPSL